MTHTEHYLAEFVGTFMLVLSVGCNVLTKSAPAFAVTSIACTLMVCIYALGDISGANFNPAVSVALGITKKMDWPQVAKYVCVQLAAGIAAGGFYAILMFEVFNLQPAPGFSWWQAGLAEFLYTFMLCFVVLNVAASKKHGGQNQFYGLAIGFVVIAGGYGGGHISGGCFNPAVAVAIDVSSAGLGFGWCLPYAIFELAGAALAAVLFWQCRPEERQLPAPEASPADEEEPLVRSSERNAPAETPMSSKLLSEFLGTYMLVLTVGLNVLGGSAAPVWSIASALMCMIFALGSVSGAHFNPAVTAAILTSGRDLISSTDAMKYIGTQLVGGILAAFTYAAMEGGKTFDLAPGKGHTWSMAYFAEFFFTFLLCFVVLSVATIRQPCTEYFGLAIGSCVMAGGGAIGAVSGGSLNPAVSFGIAGSHVMGGGIFLSFWAYTFFELLGGVVAGVIFRLTHVKEFAEKEDYPAGPKVPAKPATPVEPIPAPKPAAQVEATPAPKPAPKPAAPVKQLPAPKPAEPPAPKPTVSISDMSFKTERGDSKMDPFVEIVYGKKRVRSKVLKNAGKAAIFPDKFDDLPLMTGQAMTMAVKDFDKGGKMEPVGTTRPIVLDEVARAAGGAAQTFDLFKEGQDEASGQITVKFGFKP